MLPLKTVFPLMDTMLSFHVKTPPPPVLAELQLKVVFSLMVTLLLPSTPTPPPYVPELSLKVVLPLMVTLLLSLA